MRLIGCFFIRVYPYLSTPIHIRPCNINNQPNITPRIFHGCAAWLALCNTGVKMPKLSHKRTLPINLGTARTVGPIGVNLQHIER